MRDDIVLDPATLPPAQVEILEKAEVAVTPGLDFDPVRGHQTLRFSYARSTEDIVEGLQRLKAFMAAR